VGGVSTDSLLEEEKNIYKEYETVCNYIKRRYFLLNCSHHLQCPKVHVAIKQALVMT
jgi:hypothetical protein